MTVPFDDIDAALAWVDDHINFEAAMPVRQAVPSLSRMYRLMELLGDPAQAYPVVHITGTNGKGSTAAMAASLLMVSGLTVGTYTSPNLSRVHERIARDGEAIDDQSLLEVLDGLARLEPLVGERPTRFELLTAAALAWFADEAVDVAVVEVGLGGTWDATNVVDGDVAVLTTISYDHTEVLGPTLEDIAGDKSGIVKPGSRVVVGEQDPGIVALIRDRATAAGAASFWVRGADFGATANRVAVGGRLLDLRTPGAAYGEVLLPLHGAHQGENAAVALAAVEAFFDRPLHEDVVEAGFGAVRVPGRLEVVRHQPLVVLDGAHNAAGMLALARALVEEFTVDGELTAVIGMLQGRDPSALLEALVTAGVRSVVVAAPDSPRALRAEVLAEAAGALGLAVTVADNPTDAVERALSVAGSDDVIVVCGSLYVVAEARELLVDRGGRTRPGPAGGGDTVG